MRHLCVLLLIFFQGKAFADGGCPYENSESIVRDYLYDIRLPFVAIQYFNIKQPDSARNVLAKNLSSTVHGLAELLSFESCFESEEELSRAWGMIRVLAVMNDKYPVPEWAGDKKLLSIFKMAVERDPSDTVRIQNRDWTKQP